MIHKIDAEKKKHKKQQLRRLNRRFCFKRGSALRTRLIFNSTWKFILLAFFIDCLELQPTELLTKKIFFHAPKSEKIFKKCCNPNYNVATAWKILNRIIESIEISSQIKNLSGDIKESIKMSRIKPNKHKLGSTITIVQL